MREGDADDFAGRFDAIDAIAEDRFDVAGERAEDDCGEFAAGQTDVTAVRHARKGVHLKAGDALAGGIDGAQFAEHETFTFNFGQQAHALGDVVAGAPEVYQVASGAQVRSCFDNGG